jgi:hypothetical protein
VIESKAAIKAETPVSTKIAEEFENLWVIIFLPVSYFAPDP